MSTRSCTVRVTIFSTGNKFQIYLVTHSYSSQPFLCALVFTLKKLYYIHMQQPIINTDLNIVQYTYQFTPMHCVVPYKFVLGKRVRIHGSSLLWTVRLNRTQRMVGTLTTRILFTLTDSLQTPHTLALEAVSGLHAVLCVNLHCCCVSTWLLLCVNLHCCETTLA